MIVWCGNLQSNRKIVYKRYMGLPIDIIQYIDLFGSKTEFVIHYN